MEKQIVNFIRKFNPRNFYIYSRVSTGKQAKNSSTSLGDQRKLCNEFIKKYYSSDVDISIYEDIGSSFNNKQVLYQLNKLVSHMLDNSVIIISKVSRLGRNYKQVTNILRKIVKKKSFVIAIDDLI